MAKAIISFARGVMDGVGLTNKWLRAKDLCAEFEVHERRDGVVVLSSEDSSAFTNISEVDHPEYATILSFSGRDIILDEKMMESDAIELSNAKSATTVLATLRQDVIREPS